MGPSSQIGHYRVTGKLGEGGMGAVYRATDTKLGRDVAIKVLPPGFAEDTARMQRFEREAQVLASLNHPNIAAIYGVEQSAIVMELVEGDDLKGPLPVDTVMEYARQIAAGLEAAHEKGVVHRDLKPANIKVAPDGTVKLLDFGLAKATEETTAASGTMSPTMSLAMTRAGVILGTAAYMSPEQARGKPVDQRADIWAYGVVLYEILTGAQLFGGGETVTDTLASVVKDTPDLNKLPPDTPLRLRRLIGLCLQKDPRQRLRHIGDARILLDEADAPAPAFTAPAAARPWLLWGITAAALAIAAVAAGVAWLRPAATDSGPGAVHFPLAFPPGTALPPSPSATEWVPSPDGRNLAIVAGEDSTSSLWLRPLNSVAPHRIDRTEGAGFPFWSPDGQSIGFFTQDKLKRVAVSGGAVQTICNVAGLGRGSAGDGATWSKDGFILFASAGNPLMRVSALGGIPAPATKLQKGESGHLWPQLLPDGRHVLYLSAGADPAIYVEELGSGKRVRVLKTPGRAVWSPPGYLLFTREGTLFAQRMNGATWQLESEPASIAEEVNTNDTAGRSTFAASQNGVLVYRQGLRVAERQLNWRDLSGKVLNPVGKPGTYRSVSISPDEKIASLVVGSQTYDVWVMDMGTGVLSAMTHDARHSLNNTPMWSPDSTKLAVTPLEGGVHLITVASGKIDVLTKEGPSGEDWSPDGKTILCRDAPGHQFSLLSLAAGFKSETVLTSQFRFSSARFSPDGKYVAYTSDETGEPEVYVASFPSFAVKRRISTGGGTYPAWARATGQLFYRATDGMLMAIDVRMGAKIEAGIPKPLFRFGSGRAGNRFAVSADGKRFLTNDLPQARGADQPELTVVINWEAALKH